MRAMRAMRASGSATGAPAAGVVVDGLPVTGARALALCRWVAAHAAEIEAIEFGSLRFHLSPGDMKPGAAREWPKIKTPRATSTPRPDDAA